MPHEYLQDLYTDACMLRDNLDGLAPSVNQHGVIGQEMIDKLEHRYSELTRMHPERGLIPNLERLSPPHLRPVFFWVAECIESYLGVCGMDPFANVPDPQIDRLLHGWQLVRGLYQVVEHDTREMRRAEGGSEFAQAALRLLRDLKEALFLLSDSRNDEQFSQVEQKVRSEVARVMKSLRKEWGEYCYINQDKPRPFCNQLSAIGWSKPGMTRCRKRSNGLRRGFRRCLKA